MTKKRFALIFSLVLLAGAAVSCVTLSENWFLYPESYSDLPVQNTGVIKGEEVTCTAKDGTTLSGILLTYPGAQDYLLYFYGNMSSIKESAKRLYFLAAEYKFNVVCFDYRGYGKSAGKADFDNLAADGLVIYDFVKQTYCKDKCDIYMYTQSVGTVPGTWLGANRDFSAIVMEAPFTDAKEAVSHMTDGLIWPFKDIIKLKADDKMIAKKNQPINNIRKFKAPLMIIHGENDNCFPISQGQHMYDAAGSHTKFFCRLRDTSHADVNIYEGVAFNQMKEFLKKYKK